MRRSCVLRRPEIGFSHSPDPYWVAFLPPLSICPTVLLTVLLIVLLTVILTAIPKFSLTLLLTVRPTQSALHSHHAREIFDTIFYCFRI